MATDYKDGKLIQKFNAYRSYKEAHVLPTWRLIYSLYNGNFWEVFKDHIEDFTITPETNYIEYVVQAFMNSIYSGSFIGTLTAVRAEDVEKVQKLNAFLSYDWLRSGIKNKFLDIGRMGELYNFGPARVEGISSKDKKIILKVLTQDEVYIDPQSPDYRDGEAIFIERTIHMDKLIADPDMGAAAEEYDKLHAKQGYVNRSMSSRLDNTNQQINTNNRVVSLIECFIKNETGGIDQIYILDEKEVIFVQNDIALEQFPIEIFQPERPQTNPYGTPKVSKILNTVIALNLIDSIEATHPYRILNRPRFVNIAGQIDMKAFADYGNTPGAFFPVNGNPQDIIYYQDVPQLPDMTLIKAQHRQSIQDITGVDMAYRGRQTNSVQTTGATQAFQARVTMLTDNSRIIMLEEFTENLTNLILKYYIKHGGNYEYNIPEYSYNGTKNVIKETKLDFKNFQNVPFRYSISASTLLPMNQANLFESARALYEMQGQYQFKTQIVTEEDIVQFSDFPQKDLWLQRIAKAKLNDIASDVEATFKNAFIIYTKLVNQGLSDEEAAQQTIQILIEEKQQMALDPTLGRGFE